ncbi:glycosyltransferase family 4 protein [Biomaibacter acetigenes]|uniref:glycosyltransferase family 4 protein n=1 Tax=Biomaibacter acetigenes TaxID=2316383 RepID=UPI001CA3C17A|nr:glycosyltransferase family 4 protein [Biomaibacter acetigenes]
MLPAWAEEIISILKIPYIVDYDDAIFHNYDLNKKRIIRSLLKNKIDKVMKNAAVVIVGNDYLAERAQKAGARRIEYLPTVIDLNRYKLKECGIGNNEIFKIGWIGSPATSKYLYLIQDAFKEICLNIRFRLILVGSNKINLSDIPIEIKPWREETEVEDIKEFDVGIMPLVDEPWERGKCGYKLIQYMACGVPVVGSPVGINNKIIIDGINGFKANTINEWIYAFKKLHQDYNLRLKMGQAGRKLVEQNYCIQVTAPKLIKIIKSI